MDRDVRQLFGEAVRDRRRHLGFSQDELAQQAGLDRTYISGIERGLRNPTLLTQAKIAVALRVRLSSLLIEEDS